ncbi:hypothetical protein PVNG_05842 [Plasmodium vivax North Korean]|uniref:Variable surface protein n=1 Tax=Plasmodium vivax North Korean TaxID=1035514 RepID=A0A0J9TMA0_PLAVI|nr:hypothetical protein PVNG_05842 [Plasmodium vivax North Korean]
MTFLKRCHLNHKANSKFVLKIKTISKSLEYGSKIHMSLDRRSYRVLATYEKQNDIRNTRLQYKVPLNEENCKMANVRENKNTYEHLKRGSSNHMEAYLKCYNQRYNKKKGLEKLDCFCEKKLFKSLHKMEKIAAQKNKGKNIIKKLIYKKYGLPLILLSFIPLFGLILPIKYFNDLHLEKGTCKKIKQQINGTDYEGASHQACDFLSETYVYLNYFFVFSSIFITILLIIYSIIKVAKYERIKHGY